MDTLHVLNVADSLDPNGRRDFVNNGIIKVSFPASDMRQAQEVTIPLVDDDFKEAQESLLVLIDQNFTIPGVTVEFLRDGIALITIADDDCKQQLCHSLLNYIQQYLASHIIYSTREI